MPPTRIAILEDDPIVRDALHRAIAACEGFTVVGLAESVHEGLALLALEPDVLLIDLALPDGTGLDVLTRARDTRPTCKLIVISVLGDVRSVVRAIEAGADGYLLKGAEDVQIATAIRTVLEGGAPISPAVAGHILRRIRASTTSTPADLALKSSLTDREVTMLQALAKGLTLKEVAQVHGISHFTVGDHVKSIYKKLGVSSRGEAVFEAIQAGIISVRD